MNTMPLPQELLEKLKAYGVGRRTFDDPLFANDKPPPRYAIYDEDEENLCHEIVNMTCHIPGCSFSSETLLEYENHYNTKHRFNCSQCKKILPSAHLLDLHIQETHDSFFAVLSTRKPSYCCYIEECKEKFQTSAERRNHGIQIHKLPKDFRFDQSSKQKGKKPKNKLNNENMEVDSLAMSEKKIYFSNSKTKAFPKYKGKKFTDIKKKPEKDVNIDAVMEELKDSLPDCDQT